MKEKLDPKNKKQSAVPHLKRLHYLSPTRDSRRINQDSHSSNS